MAVSPAVRADSSRTSWAAAGWANRGKPGKNSCLVQRAKRANFPRRFNWLRPRVLLESRNDFLAKLVEKADTDIVNDERMRWMASQRALQPELGDLVLDATALGAGGKPFSFLAVGDPGEADISQYVVVPHLLAQNETSFMVIVSDVIYPTGESNDYADAFYRAYQDYDGPIYALPGNHDWYSLLTGFMWNICGAEPLPEPTERLSSYSWQERLARFLWLRPRTPERELLMAYRDQRLAKAMPGLPAPRQRTPYFAIDTGSLLVVCIDTGTSGMIDRDQGHWLCQMAKRDGPKILLTGKPLYVDGHRSDCKIKWLPKFSDDRHPERTDDPRPSRTGDEPLQPCGHDTVNQIVAEPQHRFIAAIGGDVHNYQRYPIGGVQYIVSGGGGAFMSPTHTIRPLAKDHGSPIDESEFRSYPLRGDSLARFALGSVGRLWLTALGLIGLSLLLWFLALQVWNPDNDGLDGRGVLEDWFVSVLEGANLSPETDVRGIAPLSWLPDADFGDWGAVVFGGVLLAIGAALLLLPWFNWRVKVVLALVAAGAALLAWHRVLFDLPGGWATYAAVGAVGPVAVVLLSREWARELRLLTRALIVAGLLLAAVITADWEPTDSDWWIVVPEFFSLAAVAFVLVGGPRLTGRSSVLAGASILALTLILVSVPTGWSAFPLALVAGAVSLAAIGSAVLLIPILRPGTVGADQAAQFLSGSDSPVRPTAASVDLSPATKAKLDALNRVSLVGETIYAALFDNDNQPFFKHFLRIEVDGDEVKIYCFGVAEEHWRPPVEDHVRWDGSRWTESRAILGEGGTSPVRGEVDWYPGAELRFHLDADEGELFTVLFSDGDGWTQAGELTYCGPGQPWYPNTGASAPPRLIGLRRRDDAGGAPTYAEGTFV